MYDFIDSYEDAKINSSKSTIMDSIENEIGKLENALYSRSLLIYSERIKAKTLILNGENDQKNIPSQSIELANCINRYGGGASYIIFNNPGIFISVGKHEKLIDSFIA